MLNRIVCSTHSLWRPISHFETYPKVFSIADSIVGPCTNVIDGRKKRKNTNKPVEIIAILRHNDPVSGHSRCSSARVHSATPIRGTHGHRRTAQVADSYLFSYSVCVILKTKRRVTCADIAEPNSSGVAWYAVRMGYSKSDSK